MSYIPVGECGERRLNTARGTNIDLGRSFNDPRNSTSSFRVVETLNLVPVPHAESHFIPGLPRRRRRKSTTDGDSVAGSRRPGRRSTSGRNQLNIHRLPKRRACSQSRKAESSGESRAVEGRTKEVPVAKGV